MSALDGKIIIEREFRPVSYIFQKNGRIIVREAMS